MTQIASGLARASMQTTANDSPCYNGLMTRSSGRRMTLRVSVGIASLATCVVPRTAVAEAPATHVHVQVDPKLRIVLETHASDSAEWTAACEAPCDVKLPLERDYRVSGYGIRTSGTIHIGPTAEDSVILVVRPVSKKVNDAGLVLVGIGFVTFVVGDAMSDVFLAFEAARLADHQPPPAFAADLIVPGIVIAAAGAATFLTGGAMYLTTRWPTGLYQSTTPSAPAPRWYDVSAGGPPLPSVLSMPAFSGRF